MQKTHKVIDLCINYTSRTHTVHFSMYNLSPTATAILVYHIPTPLSTLFFNFFCVFLLLCNFVNIGVFSPRLIVVFDEKSGCKSTAFYIIQRTPSLFLHKDNDTQANAVPVSYMFHFQEHELLCCITSTIRFLSPLSWQVFLLPLPLQP